MKKSLYFFIVIGVIFTMIGCSNEINMSLDYIKEPDLLIINSGEKLRELEDLGDKVSELSKNPSKENEKELSDLMNKASRIQNQSRVEIGDRAIIGEIIKGIKSTKGPFSKINNYNTKDIKNELMYKIDLRYNSIIGKINNDNLANYIKEGYILTFIIFNDGTIGLPIYSEKAERNQEMIKVKVDKEVISKIKDLYINN